jgi:glutathione-independent formaldehyde dehydrogenase
LVSTGRYTGEIIEKGRDVEFLNVGDLVSAPFNVACGRCRNCREGNTGICLNVNGDRAGRSHAGRGIGPIQEKRHLYTLFL